MSTTWVGPSVNNNLRLDLEKAAPALAKAGHATTGAPVMLSLKLERLARDYDVFIHVADQESDAIVVYVGSSKGRLLCPPDHF
jgi:hypothetical protein